MAPGRERSRPGEDDGPNVPGGARRNARRHYDRLSGQKTDLKGGKAAPEPLWRGGAVMADQAVCSRPVFFPFRSADVGAPKVAAAGAGNGA